MHKHLSHSHPKIAVNQTLDPNPFPQRIGKTLHSPFETAIHILRILNYSSTSNKRTICLMSFLQEAETF